MSVLSSVNTDFVRVNTKTIFDSLQFFRMRVCLLRGGVPTCICRGTHLHLWRWGTHLHCIYYWCHIQQGGIHFHLSSRGLSPHLMCIYHNWAAKGISAFNVTFVKKVEFWPRGQRLFSPTGTVMTCFSEIFGWFWMWYFSWTKAIAWYHWALRELGIFIINRWVFYLSSS